MLNSHSRSTSTADPQRAFRLAVLNGVSPPAEVIAMLEARGINVGELETRLRHNMGFVR